MFIIASILTAMVALEHLLILWLEMFAWDTWGRKVFKGALSQDLFTPTKVLAANQGLYNGFLALGLIWTFFIKDPGWSQYIRVFFLSCIIAAGIFGAVTASKKIFYVQSLPAFIALLTTIFSF
jgi:putative membrane protein